jgi:hypothetical protein
MRPASSLAPALFAAIALLLPFGEVSEAAPKDPDVVFTLEGLRPARPGQRARGRIAITNRSAEPLVFAHAPLSWPRSCVFRSVADPTQLRMTTSAGSHGAPGTKPVCFEGVEVFEVARGRTLRRPIEIELPTDLTGPVIVEIELAVLLVPPDRACAPPHLLRQTVTAKRTLTKPRKAIQPD